MDPTTTYTKNRESDLVIWTLFVVTPLAFYPWALGSDLTIGAEAAGVLEFWSSVAALIAGVMILIHFFANGSRFFLMISLAFLLQGGEDIFNSLHLTPWLNIGPAQGPVPGMHVCGRLFLIACIMVGYFVRKKYTEARLRRRRMLQVLGVGAVAAGGATALVGFLPFERCVLPGNTICRPVDLVLAVLFLAAFFLFVRAYRKREYRTPFVYSMIGSIAFGFAAQIFMIHCRAGNDAQYIMFVTLKTAQSIFPMFGIAIGTFRMFKRQEQMSAELQAAFDREASLAASAAAAAAERYQKEKLAKALKEAQEARALAERETAELERMNRVMVGREIRMTELKKRIAELEKEVEKG
ncbi:MAG: DUF4200 domain-containing protein [Deltaproteobacteria bacterium]|nr:DUF4200 domain-containing protein [Deltaproteobacteria bacterium]